MKKSISILSLLLCTLGLSAQFAPPAGQAGTTAISKDSSVIVGWAQACSIQRGLQDIANATGGYASVGDSTSSVGPAGTNGIVSLGDSGVAILTFSNPIMDGPGFDFAVFENSFSDDFLEFGFVEVSSDGINYVRFDATSNIQDTAQTSSFGLSDATLVNNLAGKYRANFGTPFDLQELSGHPGLDIYQITHVKIIDVVGSIGAHASSDAFGHKVNDPYPTAFASSGFDLDAVGVIHELPVGVKEPRNEAGFQLFPNPAKDLLTLRVQSNETSTVRVINAQGIHCMEWTANETQVQKDISTLAAGIYIVEVSCNNKRSIQKLIVQ